MRLGVFGGVFNPPHLGHLILAQEAFVQLRLEAVAFVPIGQATHRQIEQDPGAELRFTMCAQALAGDERFDISRVEIDREGPSYTVDTLRELQRNSPAEDLYLLIGGDQAAALGSWHAPDEILSLARVAVAERDGWRREEISERLAGLPSGDRLEFFDMPRVEVSSTLVRRRVRAGEPIRYLVPDAVARLIAEHRLYARPAAVPAG
ncbi:MAG: nicotinate-nucleotide adenylyltransferase [Thermoleophilaceae bacterium]